MVFGNLVAHMIAIGVLRYCGNLSLIETSLTYRTRYGTTISSRLLFFNLGPRGRMLILNSGG